MKLDFLISKDGSHTLVREDLNETYHSHNGAIAESNYVFIDKGLRYLLNQSAYPSITIFEVGFGTGLNAALAYQFARLNHIKVHFISLEPFPVPLDIASKLNYCDFLDIEQEDFAALHKAHWNEVVPITPYFSLEKIEAKLEDFEPKTNSVDCIFYDAFAPSKQAEVWQLDNLKKSYECLRKGGVLVTYCAQGQFKRNLKEVDFEVETLEGAPPKREMVRGVK